MRPSGRSLTIRHTSRTVGPKACPNVVVAPDPSTRPVRSLLPRSISLSDRLATLLFSNRTAAIPCATTNFVVGPCTNRDHSAVYNTDSTVAIEETSDHCGVSPDSQACTDRPVKIGEVLFREASGISTRKGTSIFVQGSLPVHATIPCIRLVSPALVAIRKTTSPGTLRLTLVSSSLVNVDAFHLFHYVLTLQTRSAGSPGRKRCWALDKWSAQGCNLNRNRSMETTGHDLVSKTGNNHYRFGFGLE